MPAAGFAAYSLWEMHMELIGRGHPGDRLKGGPWLQYLTTGHSF